MTVDLKKVKTALKDYAGSDMATAFDGPAEMISTGNLAFDLISDGGVPWGHSVEFLGESQSGKSLFIYQIIANAMRDYGAVGIIVDRENAYTPSRGEQLGINNDNLFIAKPKSVPSPVQAFAFMRDTIQAIRSQDEEAYIVIGLDSIAAFDKDVDLEKSDSGRKAKSIHEGFRHLMGHMDEKTVLLIANQVIYQIGVMYGDPRTSTAGGGMKYYNTVRFALQDKSKIIDTKRGNEVVGNWIGIEVIKTRLGPCYRTAFVRHLYKTGIDYYSGYARLLAQRGYLEPTNKKEFGSFKQSTLKYGDNQISEHKIEALLDKFPELKFDKYPEYREESNDEKSNEETDSGGTEETNSGGTEETNTEVKNSGKGKKVGRPKKEKK